MSKNGGRARWRVGWIERLILYTPHLAAISIGRCSPYLSSIPSMQVWSLRGPQVFNINSTEFTENFSAPHTRPPVSPALVLVQS